MIQVARPARPIVNYGRPQQPVLNPTWHAAMPTARVLALKVVASGPHYSIQGSDETSASDSASAEVGHFGFGFGKKVAEAEVLTTLCCSLCFLIQRDLSQKIKVKTKENKKITINSK